ncbi:predicted protein [Micromonas commoda]|uniref:Uncharacterized protein n=1 Tax=Micromonas commoda (strain RCC299 / NOUM17 / CCMP2709) TaxID=296587 RepID=C1E3N8_MICCC|nr:predicted protein [Micromonas commoda]ACO62584.1 predicted protein [Micromonas commoda]|eukprot:XP_002501326.1 predicted protein [Micromonas commoda]
MAAVAGFTVSARACVTAARQTSIARKSTVVVAPPARRGSSVVTNFNPAAGDFSVTLSQGVGAGVAVVAARVVLFSLAKAGIGKNVEKWSAKCAEYGIDCSDLYHTEDQPGDAWYLIGDWKPAKAGEPKHSDTTLVGILTTRAKTHELVNECESNGISTSDVVAATYRPDNFISNEKARFNELTKRLKEAGLR